MEVEEAQKNLIWSVMPIVIGALIGGTLGHFYMRYKANTAQPEELDDNFSDEEELDDNFSDKLDAFAKKLVAQNIIDEKNIEEFKKSFQEHFSY